MALSTFKIFNEFALRESLYTQNISKFAFRESLCKRKKLVVVIRKSLCPRKEKISRLASNAKLSACESLYA